MQSSSCISEQISRKPGIGCGMGAGIREGLKNRRIQTLCWIGFCLCFFVTIFVFAWLLGDRGEVTNLMHRNLAPSAEYLFGTDWLGRDMLARTLKGLCVSLGVGLFAAACSALIALILGFVAATGGRRVDRVVTWLVDVAMATPHLVLLILISFACGGGAKGVIIAVAASHWPVLTRVIRAEIMQLRGAEYVQLSRRIGKTNFYIARHHLLPHVVPQFTVGLVLLFPHAILHAAALTFLGFGLSPHSAAIGVLLADSMRYLSTGMWWFAVIPGVMLVISVKMFDILGNNLRALLDPRSCRE